ncbi:MAG: hypothetical protein HY207_11200 [Nitrospirae bacterium]|nr:hypothetical protein [Nitrospirota bacterium]
MRAGVAVLTLLCLAAWSPAATAKPFLPADDAQVLERLRTSAADPQARELRRLRAELAQNPGNLDLAVKLARRDIEQGRAEADPRFYGYAQAALGPWWNAPEPPPSVLILRATLRQSVHDFDGALADLDAVLRVQPSHPQAWLTRALIAQVRGDYPEARRSCAPLGRLSTRLVAATCRAGAASLNGEAARSFDFLRASLEAEPDADPQLRIWVLTVLAEMADRLGKVSEAETYFRQAMALGLRDSYLLGAYADSLLDQGRATEVVALLKDEIRADGLLLRLTLAEHVLHAPSLLEHVEALRARFEASRRRGDAVHKREEARFVLHLLGQPREALEFAKTNWAVQRESWDARLVLESALAAHDRSAAQPVVDWLTASKLEDVHLAQLVDALERGAREAKR